MTTERLQEFSVLAQTLNYSKASDYLFISQSVLSKHISEMERELSTKLFKRNTHGVVLTDEGKLLLHEVAPIIRQAEHTVSILSSSSHSSTGKIMINCHEQTLCEPILSFINEFKSKYDYISLDMHIIESASDISAIGSADILMSPCDFMDKLHDNFCGKKVYSQEALLAIPPYHHLGDSKEISLVDLEDENILVPYADELFGPYARAFFLAARRSRGILQKVPVESASDALLKVELGDGIMIIPHHLRKHIYPHTRTLRIIDEECRFPIFVYTRNHSDNSASKMLYESYIL